MSSVLKKKKNRLKPKDYENRFEIQNFRKDVKLSEDCFTEVFYSMQLIVFIVLYMSKEDGGFDFSKQKLKNFNSILIRHNKSYDDKGFNSMAVEESHKKSLGFDCMTEAKNFPYRPKMKMYGKKLKTMRDHNIALESINGGIETYLILAVHTLRENYRFSKEMIWKWWEKCKEISDLYARGATDKFMIQYLKDECGLEIEL